MQYSPGPLDSTSDLFYISTEEKFEQSIEAICNMLPYLLLAVGFSPSQYKDLEDPMSFQCWREPLPKVPQTRKR